MTLTVDVNVVIVGFNSFAYVFDCLTSLRAVDWRSASRQLVYVDNGSSDSSVGRVRAMFPEVMIIANDRNVGFCAACNQGVMAVKSRYVYLLNNDTRLFPDSIWPLFEFMDNHPEAAAAGNRLLNADLTDQWSARRFPTWINAVFGRRTTFGRMFSNSVVVGDYLYKSQLEQGLPFEVDWIPGSCTLVRHDMYLKAGSLPEDMHYWSDALFCGRLSGLGMKVFVVPQARLVHFEGKGTGAKTAKMRRWLIFDFHCGAFRFYCEHYKLGRLNPARWIAYFSLQARGVLLVLLDCLTAGRQSQSERNMGQA